MLEKPTTTIPAQKTTTQEAVRLAHEGSDLITSGSNLVQLEKSDSTNLGSAAQAKESIAAQKSGELNSLNEKIIAERALLASDRHNLFG